MILFWVGKGEWLLQFRRAQIEHDKTYISKLGSYEQWVLTMGHYYWWKLFLCSVSLISLFLTLCFQPDQLKQYLLYNHLMTEMAYVVAPG